MSTPWHFPRPGLALVGAWAACVLVFSAVGFAALLLAGGLGYLAGDLLRFVFLGGGL